MDEAVPYSPEVGRNVSPAEPASPHFHIPAISSIFERRPRILKCGDLFGMFDQFGDILPGEGKPDGLWHQDMRFLSGLQLQVNGRVPLLLSSTVQRNNALLVVDLTNPDMFEDSRLILPSDRIHIFRAKFLWRAACHERLSVVNFANEPVRLDLRLIVQADFADLFALRGLKRAGCGNRTATVPSSDTLVLGYHGRDGIERKTCLTFDPAPDRLTETEAIFRMEMAPNERRSLFLRIGCNGVSRAEGSLTAAERPTGLGFFSAMRHARRDIRHAAGRAATVTTSNDIFNEVLCRSMADLSMLVTDTPQGPYPYAGVPWFSTAFGRDGIITALQLLWAAPEIALGVLRFLAATQAMTHQPAADAEPGKILHEIREGEMARLGEVPFRRYYGTVDATPLFVILAGMYWQRTGDLAAITEIWPNIELALVWMDLYGDADGDGFLEYRRQDDTGLVNQGWKDSDDAVFHADGRLADGPIALSEVQGYLYAAKQAAAHIAEALNRCDKARDLRRQAIALQDRFERAFWSDSLGFYALALDGRKAPCLILSSNAGQVLFSGIAGRERARRVADALFGQAFFSGWGIRTIAASEARYNPMSYHNGSIWPHDNAMIALGLAHYGFKDELLKLFSGLFDATAFMDLRRLPELFCGFRRSPEKGPTLYPVACSPQAWASAAPFALLGSCLGLGFDHEARLIRLHHPRLPDFLDEVRITNLWLGDGAADLLIRRHGPDVTVTVERRRGDIDVAIIL